MEFTDEQIQMLSEPLDSRQVGEIKMRGRSIPFIAIGDAIKNANRIFGYGRWYVKFGEHRVEPFAFQTQGENSVPMREQHIQYGELYLDGEPTGWSGVGMWVAALHDPMEIGRERNKALKGARTDCVKRCLRWYGSQFGAGIADESEDDMRHQGEQPPPQSTRQPAAAQSQKRGAFDHNGFLARVNAFPADPRAFQEAAIELVAFFTAENVPRALRDTLESVAAEKGIIYDTERRLFVRQSPPPAANPSGAGLPEAPMPGADAPGQAQLGA